VNESLVSASKGQVANQNVSDATSATFLTGVVYNPLVIPKAGDTDAAAASPPDRDELTPLPKSVSAADSSKPVPGPNSYGWEASAAINSGRSGAGANLQTATFTGLFFVTHAFNNKLNILGVAVGVSGETRGGGVTGFLRIGIGLDRGSGDSTALPPISVPNLLER
jgi:hypothetical protein